MKHDRRMFSKHRSSFNAGARFYHMSILMSWCFMSLYVLTMLTAFHGFVDSYSGLGFLLQFIINGREIYILAHPLEKVNQHGLEITGNSRKLGKSEMFSCHLLPSLASDPCGSRLGWSFEAWPRALSWPPVTSSSSLRRCPAAALASPARPSGPWSSAQRSIGMSWNILESGLKLGDFMMDRWC